MKLFNIFKIADEKVFKTSPKEQLSHIIQYIPDFYKNQRQYINAIDYFKQHEWGLTLESLVELATESTHYFSEKYWEILANTAEDMEMIQMSNHCRKQIDRNQQELNSKIPFGWTMEKIDDNGFQSYISEKIKEQWIIERHRKDKVTSLLKKGDGVYLKMGGRAGTLYVVSQSRLAEVGVELGMLGLMLYFENTNYWLLPVKKALTDQEKINMKTAVNVWASNTGTSIEF